MPLNITEEFTDILEKQREDKILPFLKNLDRSQKKEFVPQLKKLYKYYSEYTNQPGSSSYSTRWTDKQRMILSAAAFVCYGQKDFEQSSSYGIIKRKSLSEILPWYCPEWFNDYADNLATQTYVSNYFDYNWYMELIEQGYLRANNQLIAKALVSYIFEQVDKVWKYYFKPEVLALREITLKEHIWYLFDIETDIHNSDRYKQFADGSTPGNWIGALKMYTDQGKISRDKILFEAITASSKNFNQSLSNWFVDLFIELGPTKVELILLQGELLNTFNSSNSRPLNTSLKYLKDLAPEPEFAFDAFLDHAPLVLTSETKTAVSSALMILDRLAKKYPDRRDDICVIACQALIHQDEQLQVRAAKLISKYGEASSLLLKETLANYYDALFSEAKNLLTEYSENKNPEFLDTDEGFVSDELVITEITTPETFDDFVFLASQAFDQNETYHFDLLPAAVLKFQGEMTAGNILKLAPAFQRAYKTITGDWTSSRGYLDDMLAIFFIDYGQLLIKFYPKEAEPIRQMHDHFLAIEDEKKYKWSGYNIRINSGIKHWEVFTKSLGYKPYKHILLNAFFLLERKISLPLLSTPTHAPCWVSSITLIERLVQYQDANVIPGEMDFQVAISRCMKDKSDEALNLANVKLKGEYRLLVSFLFGGDYYPMEAYKLKTTWLVTSLTREQKGTDKRWFTFSGLSDHYLLADFEWSSKIEHYSYKQYNFALKKDIEVPGTRKVIKIDFGDKKRKPSAIKNILNTILSSQKGPELSLYDFTELKYQYISCEHNDIKRLIYLNPANPELLLAYIIHKGLQSPDFSGENDKKLITYTLETLFTLTYNYKRIGHLLIASCMISNDKTVRTYAAELWIKGVKENTVQSELIGQIIGTHEHIELAPLKRFTDLLLSNMYQISKTHNYELQKLISACISNMPNNPINNTKKLLDIYSEVLTQNKAKLLEKTVQEKITLWQKNESLAKTITKIRKQLV